MKHGVLLIDKSQARKIRMQVIKYILVVDELYRKGFSSPLLKCLDQYQAEDVLRELHKGIYDLYVRERTMATIVLKDGYYWLTFRTNYSNFVKNCF